MVDLKTLEVGQTLYCSQVNECCEGWSSTSFHKTEVVSIKNFNNYTVIEFSNDVSSVYLDDEGKDSYGFHLFFETKEEILDYISSEILN